MGTSNLKDFGIQWIILGLLAFSLLTFAMTFTINNNPIGLGDTGDKFQITELNFHDNLITTENSSNSLLNISAQNDPEVSDLGSKDSVAASYGIMGVAKTFLSSLKLFMGWIFSGANGQILTSVFAGMFGIVSLYYITKWIRSGS